MWHVIHVARYHTSIFNNTNYISKIAYFSSTTSKLVFAAAKQTNISSIVDLIVFKFLEITLIINLEASSKSIISYENDSGSSGAIAASNNSARDLGPVSYTHLRAHET